MPRLIKASTYLLETARLTPTVYHTTEYNSLFSILQQNQFRLSKSSYEIEDFQNIKNLNTMPHMDYFMSVSRTKNSYFRTMSNKDVLLVLDGDKFNEKYKSVPFDYFALTSEKPLAKMRLKYDEYEERIFSKNIKIPNAISYIKEIHLYVSGDYNLRKIESHYNILKGLTNIGIGIYVYLKEYKKEFKQLDKRVAFKLTGTKKDDELLGGLDV